MFRVVVEEVGKGVFWTLVGIDGCFLSCLVHGHNRCGHLDIDGSLDYMDEGGLLARSESGSISERESGSGGGKSSRNGSTWIRRNALVDQLHACTTTDQGRGDMVGRLQASKKRLTARSCTCEKVSR